MSGDPSDSEDPIEVDVPDPDLPEPELELPEVELDDVPDLADDVVPAVHRPIMSGEEPLRDRSRAIPPLEAEDVVIETLGPRPLRVIAVGGARGGVGKTVIAANLGLYFASIGRRVVLVDADPAGASLHTCLGTAAPAPLSRVRRSQRGESNKSLVPEEALRETAIRGLRLLHIGLDEPGSVGRSERTVRLLSGLRELDAEYVIVDLGVGLGRETLDTYLSADLSVFVTLPEPTAMENTYRFLRGAFARFALAQPKEDELQSELERRVRAHGGAPSPLDLYRELEQEGHPLAASVRDAMARYLPHVIVNQTRLRSDLTLGQSMQSAARRKLGIQIDYVGYVDHDDTVWTCIRNRRPLLIEVPGARSSRKIEKIARRLLMIDAGKVAIPQLPMPTDAHHDVLEVERGASDEDVRRAYKRCREIYSHDSLCCYGLFEPHEIEQMRARVDEAFDVLLDPARRRPYEMSVFTEQSHETPKAKQAEDDEPPPAAPDLTPDSQFTGPLLKQVRESQRLALIDISQRTKISVTYLRAIEEDDFARLPALVYTTGFVKELARVLKLDAQQVSRTYIARVRRYLEEKERAFARKT